jgi:hypothetical protein
MKLLSPMSRERKTKDRLTYDSWATDFKMRLNLALATWLNQVGYAAGLLLKSLRDKAEQWWYFLNAPSVPLDNNLAERSRATSCHETESFWWLSFDEAI